MPYVFKAKHPYVPPDENGLVETIPFLKASGEILVLIDYLGPSFLKSAFHRTRADIAGNITTLENKYLGNPAKYRTLISMLEDEEAGAPKPATIALLWLKRGLEFIFHFCQLLTCEETMKKDNQDLCSITLQAYEQSLRRFHNFFVRGLFYVVAHILPSKKGFIKILAGGQDNKEDEVYHELRLFVEGLSPNLQIINDYYICRGMNEDA